MKSIVFFVEAGPKSGLGHFHRSARLAKEFEELGFEVFFDSFNLEADLAQKLKDSGLEVLSDAFIPGRLPDLAIVDGYGFENSDMGPERAKKVAVFEDYKFRSINPDIVIDANLAQTSDYLAPDKDKSFYLIQGEEYIVIDQRHAFTNRSPEVEDLEKNLLVSLGGSDPKGITWEVLEQIEGIQSYFNLVTVVIGPMFKDVNKHVEKFKKRFANLEFSVKPEGLWKLNRMHDVAIGAGGTSAYERVSSGLASLNLVTENNQLRLANNLSKAGLALSLDVRFGEYLNLKNELLKIDFEFRERVRKQGPLRVDGHGSKRLASKISGLI